MIFKRKYIPFYFLLLSISLCLSCVTVGPPEAQKKYKTIKGGFYHRVVAGEDLFEIAKKYQVGLNYLASINKLDKYAKLPQGKYIYIPPKQKEEEDKNVIYVKDPDGIKGADRGMETRKSAPAAKTPAFTSKQSPKTSANNKNVVKSSSPPSKYGYMWPVDGEISRGYTDSKSEKHKGIDIVAPAGSPVLAAKSGVVIYEGDSMPGYGNMVIIDHGNGYASLYAHHKKNIARINQKVRQGETIALVGSTGRSTGPHLHIEIRQNAIAVNPAPYFP